MGANRIMVVEDVMGMDVIGRRAGWPAMLALALLAGAATAQEAEEPGAGGDGEPVVIDGVPPEDGVGGEDPILIDDLPVDDGGVGEEWPGDEVLIDPLPVDDVPVESDCGGCEYEITAVGVDGGGGVTSAGDRLLDGPDRGEHWQVGRAAEGSPDICTSQEYYVAWLCDWQGYERP